MISMESSQVCGSDDKTYSNECFMEMESCRSSRALTAHAVSSNEIDRNAVSKKHDGKCGEPRTKARNYLYKKK